MNFKGWDINNLRRWLQQSSTQEDDSFDLKEMIPQDESGKTRLKKEFCGFANQKGGFILYYFAFIY
jgi:predicted HTH transcriptional regulator